MKLWKLGAFSGLTFAETEVHFNHDHYMPEIAALEKWNALAKKFFKRHQEDLRPSFYRRWAVTPHGKFTGRFEKEIYKLEQNLLRNCAGTYQTPRRNNVYADIIGADEVDAAENNSVEDTRKRRSGNQPRVENDPGHRMRHIVHNIKKWTEEYLTGCSNQQRVIARWQRFIEKWESEIEKNQVFQEEFKKEERYLRNNNGPGRPCGKIFQGFSYEGYSMELYDGSYDLNNRINDLRNTDFGNDQLKSMRPYEGLLEHHRVFTIDFAAKKLVSSTYFKVVTFEHISTPTNKAFLQYVAILLEGVLSMQRIMMVL